MFQIDVKSRKPIYEQIVDYFKELIISGAMKKDEKAPSVRELAKELTINPNTIQKAYRELENRGFFYSITGVGSFVSGLHEEEIRPSKLNEMRTAFMSALKELLYYGCPHDEIFSMLEDCGLKLTADQRKSDQRMSQNKGTEPQEGRGER